MKLLIMAVKHFKINLVVWIQYNCSTMAETLKQHLGTHSGYKKFTFNKIYIIESLPDNELQTGLSLYEDLLRWSNHVRQEIYSEYWGVETKRHFELCLEALYIDTVFGCNPFIHFEIHGSSNFDGLILKSNELVTWNEVAEMTRKINQSVKNNLVISFATCYSGYFIKAVDIIKAAPFHGCVITLDLLTISEIEMRFNSFFSTLLSSFDFDLVIQILNEIVGYDYKLLFLTSEKAFNILFKRVLNEKLLKNPEGPGRIEEIVSHHANSKSSLFESKASTRKKQIRNFALKALSDVKNDLKNNFLIMNNNSQQVWAS